MAKPTLILIDAQKAFDDPEYGATESRNNPGAEANIARLLAAWREAGAPIVHVHHFETDPAYTMFHKGSEGFEFKPEAEPADGEPVIEKSVNSAFIGTDLEQRLRDAGAEALVMAGITTDHCVSTTVRMAGNMGFDTTVVDDACYTFPRESPDGEVFPADLVHRIAIASLNEEFAEAVSTDEAIERLAGATS